MTRRKAVFAMVTTERSCAYTPHALASFLRHTPLLPEDEVYLIDNDGAWKEPLHPRVTLIRNAAPRSFAQNVNQMLERAAHAKAPLFFLNNDLIFSAGWLEPMLHPQPVILCPFSNREAHHRLKDFECKTTLTLEDYLGKEALFEKLAELHRAQISGYQLVLSLPFFCVRLPYEVYSVVGSLDESFGRGGAEDDDYCVRAYLAGFAVAYARQSYVLHFNGKSTWCVESKDETDARVGAFRERFSAKWGDRLRDLLISHDMTALSELPGLPPLSSRETLAQALKLVIAAPARARR